MPDADGLRPGEEEGGERGYQESGEGPGEAEGRPRHGDRGAGREPQAGTVGKQEKAVGKFVLLFLFLPHCLLSFLRTLPEASTLV